jgi:hypothetical protein
VNFVSCSDVLEHVPYPVDSALTGLRSILTRPSGFAVISVPNSNRAETWEYYPNLANFEVCDDGKVSWSDRNGCSYVDDEPEFHGGGGQTLTFREWSLDDLSTRLLQAGFSSVTSYSHDDGLGVPEIDVAGMLIAWV